MALVEIVQLSLDYRGSIVEDVLDALVRKIDERYIVKVPLLLAERRHI